MTLIEQFLFIAQGIYITLKYTLGALAIGFSLGLALVICRQSRWLKYFIDVLVSFLRGTPLLLQLSFFYFTVPNLIGFRLDLWYAGLIAFGLNSAAYTTEIFRAGIQAIPKSQFEAAYVLQISSFLLWKDIIFPQMFRNILPALVNEVISLLKETAIISMLGELDITRRSQIVAASQFNYFVPICIAGSCYYILVFLIERIAKYLEKIFYVKH